MYKKILVCLDGSAQAERALPHAAQAAKASQATVLLAQVVPSFSIISLPIGVSWESAQQDLLAAQQEATTYLDTLRAGLSEQGVHARVIVKEGRHGADESLLEIMHAERPDLVVLSSHGRTGLARWFLGSVAERVVRTAPCPVMVVRGVHQEDDLREEIRARTAELARLQRELEQRARA